MHKQPGSSEKDADRKGERERERERETDTETHRRSLARGRSPLREQAD